MGKRQTRVRGTLVAVELHSPVMFSEGAFEELDAWLLRRRIGITDIVELEGFLTALVIGPVTLNPMTWLPKVWGGKAPKFKNLEEMNRFIALVIGYYNDLVLRFESAPDRFQPTFYESRVAGRRVIVVDEWCFGFLKGMRVDAPSWKPMKAEHPELLRPLQLFGAPAGWKEIASGAGASIHRKWSPKVAPAVRAIHQFWMPYRRAQNRTSSGEAVH